MVSAGFLENSLHYVAKTETDGFGSPSLRHYLIPNCLWPFLTGPKIQVLRAFEGKAVDYRSGNSPRSLSLWPILSKADDYGNLIRVFNALFLNDISAQQYRKVRKSAARATEFGIEPEP